MMYEKPDMEVLDFGSKISTLDIVGGPSQGTEDSSDTGGEAW